jgi:hypothetical protein
MAVDRRQVAASDKIQASIKYLNFTEYLARLLGS